MKNDGNTRDVISLAQSDRNPRNAHIAAFIDYWESMRRNGDLPRRSDIDPRGIESLLENALIAEKIAPGLARMRIAGSHLSDLMGMEVRGMPVSSFIAPEDRDQLSDLLAELFERPARIDLQLESRSALGQSALSARLVLMPLRSDLGDVSRALGCLVSSGNIGRTPRRFRIVSQIVTPIPLNENELSAAPVQGMADAPGVFEHAKEERAATHRSERPYLKVVK